MSNVVYTQIPLHQPYGGVVPEIASRAHVEKISPVVGEAIRQADAKIDAVAVTYGPGLSPALIVGLNAAKGLAKALGVPLVGINHLEAHLHSPFLYDSPDDATKAYPDPASLGPALGLAVSGGNTIWVDMPRHGEYNIVGDTLDDAAGEAFDKAAKLLGLGYPGGLKIDRISAAWRRDAADGRVPSAPLIPFPKGRPRDGVAALAGLSADLCVSYSGLKTSLLRYVRTHPELVESHDGERDFGGYAVTPALAHVVRMSSRAIRRRSCRPSPSVRAPRFAAGDTRRSCLAAASRSTRAFARCSPRSAPKRAFRCTWRSRSTPATTARWSRASPSRAATTKTTQCRSMSTHVFR